MWTLLSLYLQDLRGLDTLTTALILAVQPLAVALLSPLVGRMADRDDKQRLNIVGAVICTFGLLLLAFLGERSSLVLIRTGLLMVGVGVGLFSAPTNRNFLESLSSRFYGVGSATLSTMVYVGQTVSLGVLLSILTGYMGTVQLLPNTYPLFMEGLHVSFLIFAVSSAMGAVVTLMMRGK
jgi:MFS family permease